MATKREQLEKLVHDMKAFADECDAKGELTGEDRQKLDNYSKGVNELVASIKAEASATDTMDVAKAFLADLAGKPGEKAPSGEPEVHSSGIVNPKGMTLGEAFVKSPVFDEFLGQFKGHDGRIREVSNIKSATFDVPGFGAKALVTGASDTSGGAFVVPTRLPGATDLIGQREFTLRDLCTNITINSDTFEYVQVTGKTNNAAAVAEATTTADPTYAADTGTGAVTVTPAAGGGYKPESALTLAVVSSPVETIAHLMPITRRAAADAPQVRQMVDQFLLYGLAEEEEDQILNGNGTSPNLRGILNVSGISTVGSSGTDLDAVVDAIRTIRADRRRPNALVIHPNDWYSTGFLLAKETDSGRYLLGDPRASIDQLNTLWGLRVVVTEAMTENTALVGDFTQAVVADRQQAALYMTDSHKDWFGRNLLAVLAEERLGFGLLDPDAMCTITAL
jgi:HK97 family phage major capsid protein